MPTVEQCQRAQTAWFVACARASGGESWQDGPLTWTWLAHSRELMLMFPLDVPPDGLHRGVRRAAQLGARAVGAWLSPDVDVDVAALAEAGFERGWAPWWMTAPLDALEPAHDPQITFEADTPEYDPAYRALLTLTTTDPQDTWHAVARVDGRLVGRSWAHLEGEVAGIFDMEVWPRFQRHGLGTALVRTVAAAAATAGARHAVLNATPEGKLLYSALGFRQIGEGITWWLHR